MMNKHGGYRGDDLIDFSVKIDAQAEEWLSRFMTPID